jgi:hypothetical protein
MDALATIELVRNKDGAIVGMKSLDPTTIERASIYYAPAGVVYQYVQVADGVPVQAFTSDDLLVLPRPAAASDLDTDPSRPA